MNEEYSMLRAELMDSINKQEALTHVVFTLLGASGIFSTVTENMNFIILVEFISAILLARILHYRNTVYYLSTYLTRLENVSKDLKIKWETNLKQFYGRLPNKYSSYKLRHRIMGKIISSARSFKHLGNLILSIYLFLIFLSQLLIEIKKIYANTGSYFTPYIIMECVFAGISFLLNVIFSVAICSASIIKPVYESIWKDILKKT